MEHAHGSAAETQGVQYVVWIEDTDILVVGKLMTNFQRIICFN